MASPPAPPTPDELAGKSEALDALSDIFSGYSHHKSPPRSASPNVRGRKSPNRASATDPMRRSFGVSPIPAGRRSVSERDPHFQEVARLHELWINAKRDLQAKQREVTKLKSRLAREEASHQLQGKRVQELEQITEQAVETKDRLRYCTLQLQESRTENTHLREAHQDVVAKLDTALATIRAKSAKEEALSQQVMQLESRLASVVSEKDTSLSRSRLNDRAHAEEMARQVKEFEIQESRLKTAEDGLQRLRTERQEMVVQLESLQHELKLEKDNHAYTRTKWDLAEQRLSSHKEAEANHFRLHTQLEQLRADNARLIRLLASTTEYKEFVRVTFPEHRGDASATYDDDGDEYPRTQSSFLPPNHVLPGGPPAHADHGASMRSGKDASHRDAATAAHAHAHAHSRTVKSAWHAGGTYEFSGRGGGEVRPTYHGLGGGDGMPHPDHMVPFANGHANRHGHADPPLNADAEAQHWIPTEAVAATAEFRRHHLPHVPADLIRKFLQQLNTLWRRRYAQQAKANKRKYLVQIRELKRKLQQQEPYREVIQQRTISRLQSDIRKTRRKVRTKGRRSSSPRSAAASLLHTHSTRASKKASSVAASAGQNEMIEASLATVEALSRQVAEYAERNRELQASVHSQAALNASAVDTGVSNLQSGFQQGVVWFGRQALAVMDDLGEKVLELSIVAQKDALDAVAGMPPEAAAVLRKQGLWYVKFEDKVMGAKRGLRRLFETTLAAGANPSEFQQLLRSAPDMETPRWENTPRPGAADQRAGAPGGGTAGAGSGAGGGRGGGAGPGGIPRPSRQAATPAPTEYSRRQEYVSSDDDASGGEDDGY